MNLKKINKAGYFFKTFFHKKPLVINIKPTIKIEKMTEHDLFNTINQWAVRLDWNPGKNEAKALFSVDSGGYYKLSRNNEMIATLAAPKHSQNFAGLGLYIVKSAYRGHGYGHMLWQHVMEQLTSCPTLGLYAVTDQINNYTKSGFIPGSSVTRWQGNISAPLLKNEMNLIQQKFNEQITFIEKPSLDKIIDYDMNIYQVKRKRFLTYWLTMPHSHVIAAEDENGKIIGYGQSSLTYNGYKIAPLIANNIDISNALFARLSQKSTGNTVQIDTNSNATDIAKQFKLNKISDFRFMYTNKPPNSPSEEYFPTSIEIGNEKKSFNRY